MLRAYRRHVADCSHAHKGAAYSLCSCPIWCDGKLNGQRLRRSLDTTDWARAQTRIELLAGGGELWDAAVPVTSDTHTLAEAIEQFEADCRVRNLRDSTIGSYMRTLRQFQATVGNIAVNRLNLDTLERFRRGRMAVPKLQKKGKPAAAPPRPVTPGTQRKEIETLRAFCAFCVAHKWMPDNPAKAMKPPKLDRVPTMPFEPTEVEALLAATDELYSTDPGETPYLRRRARVLIQALLYSGLRISDVSTLRRSAVQPATGHLTLRTAKTGAPVKVKLPPHVVEAIQSLPARHPDYVFWTGEGDLETCIKNMRRTLLRLGKLAGVAKVHPHRFRDTFACRLLQHGADIRRVQLLLGHDSLHTTEKHYAPWVASHQELLDEAADLLDFEKPAARKPTLLRRAKRS